MPSFQNFRRLRTTGKSLRSPSGIIRFRCVHAAVGWKDTSNAARTANASIRVLGTLKRTPHSGNAVKLNTSESVSARSKTPHRARNAPAFLARGRFSRYRTARALNRADAANAQYHFPYHLLSRALFQVRQENMNVARFVRRTLALGFVAVAAATVSTAAVTRPVIDRALLTPIDELVVAMNRSDDHAIAALMTSDAVITDEVRPIVGLAQTPRNTGRTTMDC